MWQKQYKNELHNLFGRSSIENRVKSNDISFFVLSIILDGMQCIPECTSILKANEFYKALIAVILLKKLNIHRTFLKRMANADLDIPRLFYEIFLSTCIFFIIKN